MRALGWLKTAASIPRLFVSTVVFGWRGAEMCQLFDRRSRLVVEIRGGRF